MEDTQPDKASVLFYSTSRKASWEQKTGKTQDAVNEEQKEKLPLNLSGGKKKRHIKCS